MKTSHSLLYEQPRPTTNSPQPLAEADNRELTPFSVAQQNRFASLLD